MSNSPSNIAAERKFNLLVDSLWEEAISGNHGETPQESARWFAKAILASKKLEALDQATLKAVRDALGTCMYMADHNNDGITSRAAGEGIAIIDSLKPSVLVSVAVPRAHTEDEDCNCESVGRAKGWNAACAALGLIPINNS